MTLEVQCSNLQARLDEERKKLADSEQQLSDAAARSQDTFAADARLQQAETDLASLHADKQNLERALEHMIQQQAEGGEQLGLKQTENDNLKAELLLVKEHIKLQDAEKEAARREVSKYRLRHAAINRLRLDRACGSQ